MRADKVIVGPVKDRRDGLSVRGRRLERGGPVVAIGWSELRRRIARHSRVTHHASLAVLVGPGPVKHAPVVPDDHVTRTPAMRIGAGWPTGEVEEVGQKLLRLSLGEAGDAIGVTADEEGGSARDRMPLHERAPRRAL